MAEHLMRPLLKGYSHALAAIAAIALCPILIVFSPAGTRLPAGIFSVCVIGLFTISALYHTVDWQGAWGKILRRFDHAMIFIVIAATYTPIAAVAMPERAGKILLTAVWATALAGAAMKLLWVNAPRWVTAGGYLTLGWAALAYIVDVWNAVGPLGFVFLVAGGVAHSVGAVVYSMKRPDPWPTIFGFHELFHLFVIAGVACHYVVVAFFALR